MADQGNYEELLRENERLQQRLEEAMETIDAIRTGQVDALVVQDGSGGHQLFTLKTADQTYRLFIEKMSEGAVTLNEEGIILYCNSKFASMVNMPLSQVTGLPFESFIPEHLRDSYQETFRNGWLGDRKVELELRREDQLIPCQLSVAALDLDEGVSLSVIVTDLTFQKETQSLLKLGNERLEKINRDLELSNHDLQQFASVASHDLQEPLRKILIYSSLLKLKFQEEHNAENASYVSKVIASSNRMRTMITDVLNYSSLSKTGSQYEVTDLTKIVTEILEDFEIAIREKDAKVIVDELPKAEVNKGQIRQVFQNLISNALKFSQPGVAPVIRIGTVKPEDTDLQSEDYDVQNTCWIVFEDNGIGFDNLYKEKIFSLFERLNTKDLFEGSGIGLAISKKIIDKHNGKISASGAEGRGARFIIQLPLTRQNQ
ncbi:ATP-binding protein [Dyadobacter sp. CY323]|uniref:sensor histidine kinase n=1 Tax=Dyadobacter sp. CY323 TaxID=2907302 RepID=UPI001F20987D|nr:ATP-binding protein [Dyadobacter sp. CY323]MCE6987946.1 ATP-binding protein [Dyadobacter sp. CY323]